MIINDVLSIGNFSLVRIVVFVLGEKLRLSSILIFIAHVAFVAHFD